MPNVKYLVIVIKIDKIVLGVNRYRYHSPLHQTAIPFLTSQDNPLNQLITFPMTVSSFQ